MSESKVNRSNFGQKFFSEINRATITVYCTLNMCVAISLPNALTNLQNWVWLDSDPFCKKRFLTAFEQLK